MRLMKWLTPVAALFIGALAGCSTVQNTGTLAMPSWNYRLAAPSSLELDVLDDSLVDNAKAGGFGLTTQEVGGGQVLVNINVENAEGLKALYFNLKYDPQTLRPLTATPTEAMGDQRDLLQLTSLKQRGTVTYGQVLTNFEWRDGMSGSGTVAQVLFSKEATPIVRTPSAVPVNLPSKSHIALNGNLLEWDYSDRGDYDQNGQANISDLTPLGANFGDDTGGTGAFPRTDNRSVIDGDSNGELNISDLTPLGASLGNGITGYNVYGSANVGDIPTDAAPSTPSDVSLLLNPDPDAVLLADATNFANKTSERLQFSFDLGTADANFYYWVRPYEGARTNEGIGSVAAPAGVSPVLTLNDSVPGSGTGADPYIVQASTSYTFTVTDPTAGNADITADCTFDAGAFDAGMNDSTATLAIPAGAIAGTPFTVTATYTTTGLGSNTLNFQVEGTPTGGLFIAADSAADADWLGSPTLNTFTEAQAGTDSAKAWILHDSTFNPDGDADDVFDLNFTLKSSATSDFAVLLDNETLTFTSMPPFAALGVNDSGNKGIFTVQTLTGGGDNVFIQAQNAALDLSNKVYIQVQDLPTT